MSSSIGKLLTLTTFGESHGAAIGGILDGYPSGVEVDMGFLQAEMDRRRPGSTRLGTARNELDQVRILSGVFEGRTTGTPIAFMLENQSQISKDYSDIAHLYRPGHADYCFDQKYGFRDWRGGGRSSGRETAARVFGGAMAKLYLKKQGIEINAGVIAVAGIRATGYVWDPPFPGPLYAPSCPELEAMTEAVESARRDSDSVGGIIECRVTGMVPGLGEPVFDKLDADIAKAILSIGAVKGIEFGSGFEAASKRGSENNDPMRAEDGKVCFLSNNAGGILGGISNGNDIVFRLAVKPTSSIAREQLTVNDRLENATICVHGRHDPCIAPRAVVVAEAMTALVLLDHFLVEKAYG